MLRLGIANEGAGVIPLSNFTPSTVAHYDETEESILRPDSPRHRVYISVK